MAIRTKTAAVSASKRLTYDIRKEPPAIRSVTESRLLGLLRWHRLTAGLFAEGSGYGTLAVLDYQRFYICRAVQVWQLTDRDFAAVWIDAGADGVHLFHHEQQAREKFQLLCAALNSKSPPSISYQKVYEGETDDVEWNN